MKIKTVEDARTLIGQTFGAGKNARVVTRIENLKMGSFGYLAGNVYWKRPGGNERSVPQYLPYFLSWAQKAKQESQRQIMSSINDVANFVACLEERQFVEGSIYEDGQDIIISLKMNRDE